MKIKTLIWFVLLCNSISAQDFAKRAFSLGIDKSDGAFSIIPTSHETFLISGNFLHYNPDLHYSGLVVQTNLSGNWIDTLIYDQNGYGLDVVFDAVEFFDAYFLLGRYFDTVKSDYDTYLLKTDNRLNTQTAQLFDFGYAEEIRFLFVDSSDNSLLALGYHYLDSSFNSSQIILAKVDTNGNLIWKREYGGAGYDFAYHLLEMPDKGYMLSGEKTTFPFPNNTDTDLFLMKLDAQFNEVWTKSFGSSLEDRAGFSNNAVLTSDSGIIMTGWVNIPHPNFATSKGYVIKTDIDGNLLWEKYHEAGGFYIVEHHSVQPAPDGNYFIGGYKNDTNTLQLNSWLMKIDIDGNTIWERLHAIDSAAQYIWDMNLNSFGGVAMTGFIIYQGPAANDIVFITTDSCGYTEGDVSIAQIQLDTLIEKTITLQNISPAYCSWQWQFGDGDSSSVRNPTHTYNDTGSYTITLITRAGNDWDTASLIVHVGDTITGVSQQSSVVSAEMKLYPNPASAYIILSGYIPENITGARVEFYDIQGRLVKMELLKNGLINQSISMKEFATGVYAYRVVTHQENITRGTLLITK